MNKRAIEKIFRINNLGNINSLEKVEVGFTNKVYIINNNIIIKICEDESNQKNFEAEVFLYKLFQDQIPVPKIILFDKSKKVYKKFFMIYPKIEGENLYTQWHLLTNKQRKKIIKQLCGILKIINKTPPVEFVKKFNGKNPISWHDKVINNIQNSLKKVAKNKLLPPELIKIIKKFINENHLVLNEQNLALVYWDAHFDNILVQGTKIVGILDFERTDVSSIDFGLDIIKRMVEYPKKYMSEKFEKFAKKEDYALLLEWFREFYPELFQFKDLEKRLALYALEHDLDTLIWYPNSSQVKQMIAKTVNFKLRTSKTSVT